MKQLLFQAKPILYRITMNKFKSNKLKTAYNSSNTHQILNSQLLAIYNPSQNENKL